VTQAEDLINLVSMGETVQIWPTHVTRHWMLPDLRWLALPDSRRCPSRWCGGPTPRPT